MRRSGPATRGGPASLGSAPGRRLNQGRWARRGPRLADLDVEPIVPGEPEAALVLDRLAPVLSAASGAAAVDEAFAVGFDFNTQVVEAALGARPSLPKK
jgi:hypothetical protein